MAAVQLLLQVLSLGAAYALVALGFVLILNAVLLRAMGVGILGGFLSCKMEVYMELL